MQQRIDCLRSRAEYANRQLCVSCNDDLARDRLAEYVAEIDELERELIGKVVTLERQMQEVDAALMALPENQERVLRLRYCEGFNWDKVAKQAHYSEGHCRKLGGKKV